jgi:MoaA/NifB/PqqE/SkfB family radical SAM enzyme
MKSGVINHRINGEINFASIIVTYRCNARCNMCNTWQYPTKREEEIGVSVYEKLPFMNTVNVTGGESFLREDLDDIISVLKKKTKRIVISSNGFFTERILKLFDRHKDIGIRVSIEGLPKANDELRGIRDGFDHGLRTLVELHRRGIKDIGFGITVSDRNALDMIELYYFSKMMGLEFATAAIHNAFYFHKLDNKFEYPDKAIEEFWKLIHELLRSNKVKDWFRAYFNYGLINYIKGNHRLLPCEMGHDSFFLDPHGEILPCNVIEESMGNLKEQSFAQIWSGDAAVRVRQQVKNCQKNCWMIGSVSQQMKKYIWKPLVWVARHKFLGKEICV